MKKRLLGILLVATLLLFVGCGKTSKGKDFVEDNFKITLTENFEKKSLASATYYYENNKDNIGVTVLLETYETLKAINLTEETSLSDYANIIIKQMPTATLKTEGNFMYFTYSKTVSGNTYFYMPAMYKGAKGFYLLNFFCLDSEKDTYLDQFISWAKTVEV